MSTIQEVKEYFSQEGIRTIQNDTAGYQFVKRDTGELFQYDDHLGYKFYKTFDGFCKACLYRIKRG